MMIRRTALAAAVVTAMTVHGQAEAAAAAGLFDDDSLTAGLRTIYFNRDKKDGYADSEAAAQALRLDYSSGFAWDRIGFDASLFTVAKLKGDRGHGGTGVLQDDSDGSQDGYTKFGQAFVKVKLSDTAMLKAGRMVLDTPLFNDSDSRATPSATQAVMATGNLAGVDLYGIWSDKASAKTEDGFESYRDNRGHDYDVSVVGGGYAFANGLQVHLAYGKADNVLQQTYLNASYPVQLTDDMDLLLDLYNYRGKADGAGALDTVGKDYRSNLTDLAAQLRYDNMKLLLSYQTLNGDEYEESWDGAHHDDNGFLNWNSVQRLDFDHADEQSWQARFDYSFKQVPGLYFMTRYVNGNSIRHADGSEDGHEWERNIELKYDFPSVEGLSLRWRNSTVRSTETYASDENRLILNYKFALL